MDKLYSIITSSVDLEEDYHRLKNVKLKTIFGFICACMVKLDMLKLNDRLAADIYIDLIENEKMIEPYVMKIYGFVEQKSETELRDQIDRELEEILNEAS